MEMPLVNAIQEALKEAEMLERGRETYDIDNMLLTAMRLSGAPFSFVEMVYKRRTTNYAKAA